MLSSYLLPYKICDPVHGFIRFDEIERRVIDSPFYQRLRYIRQMGVCFLVYPGGQHTRFEHSLGVMEFATMIYETIMAKHNLMPHAKVPTEVEEKAYWRRILRLAALCHDMGHLPFSHTAEDDLFPQGGHERMTLKIIQSRPMRHLWRTIPAPNGRMVEKDIIKLALTEDELKEFDPTITLDPWERVLSQVITDDNFGADRMDYLMRDGMYTGVGYGHLDYQMAIDSLRILPNLKNRDFLTIGVVKSGVQSVESLWIARYLMSSRVYQHSKSRIYSHHMRRFMTRHYSQKGFPRDLEGYVRETDGSIVEAIHDAAQKGDYDAAVLLKKEKGFKEVFFDAALREEIIKNLKTLETTFGEALFIDYVPDAALGEQFRQFPVLLEDSNIVPSSAASSFLRDIPLTSRVLSLFCHQNKIAEVQNWLNSLIVPV